MIVHSGLEKLNLNNPVVTLGIFDGVHKGHRALLDYLIGCARERQGESVVVTFNTHPRLILAENKRGISFLSTPDEKKRLFAETGLDHLIILRFDRSLAEMEACDFVEKVLVKKIGTKHLIIGYDHHFGKSRQGDFNSVSECAEKFGFGVEQITRVNSENGIVSSTVIREALLDGNPRIAAKMLGYDYSLSGTIVRGKRIGRDIGFPTANIKPADKYKLVPGNGVYAVKVAIDDHTFMGMLSIGSNPTVNKIPDIRSIEVNIFDFEGDLYDREIRVFFIERLRDEIRFDNLAKLAEQMKIDRLVAVRILSAT
ncbi:MAG: bifunctional riboflavin kinase/FAD synthetase [Bacteroidales bacterium]|nr:bifunctional riboflavin kinase/FAD synthetase [Bacteroidales bacterium]